MNAKVFFVTFSILVIIGGVVSACGRIQQNSSPSDSDDLIVEMTLTPEDPTVGPGTLIFTVTDESGQPINEATLKIEGNMTHAGMAPVNAEVTAGENGRYEVPFEWTMGGDWFVTVNITLPDGKKISREFPVTVSGQSDQ